MQMIGRIVFAVPFAVFGIFHFINASKMVAMVPGWMPYGIAWVYLTGVGLIAGSLGIITGFRAKMAAYLLSLLVLVFILTIHAPALPSSMPNLLKDIALLGGCLMLAGIYGGSRK